MSGYAGWPYFGIRRLITGGDDDADLVTRNQALSYVMSDTSVFKVTGINHILEDEDLARLPRTANNLVRNRELPMRLVLLAHIMVQLVRLAADSTCCGTRLEATTRIFCFPAPARSKYRGCDVRGYIHVEKFRRLQVQNTRAPAICCTIASKISIRARCRCSLSTMSM